MTAWVDRGREQQERSSVLSDAPADLLGVKSLDLRRVNGLLDCSLRHPTSGTGKPQRPRHPPAVQGPARRRYSLPVAPDEPQWCR